MSRRSRTSPPRSGSASRTPSTARTRPRSERRGGRHLRVSRACGLGGRWSGRRLRFALRPGERSEALAAPVGVCCHEGATARAAPFGTVGHRRQGTPVHGPDSGAGSIRRNTSPHHRVASPSHPESVAAMVGQVWERRTRSRPASPIFRARPGSARRLADGVRHGLDARAVDEDAGLTVDQGLARPAGIADHHGTGTGRGLDEDVPPALHLETRPIRDRHGMAKTSPRA